MHTNCFGFKSVKIGFGQKIPFVPRNAGGQGILFFHFWLPDFDFIAASYPSGSFVAILIIFVNTIIAMTVIMC